MALAWQMSAGNPGRRWHHGRPPPWYAASVIWRKRRAAEENHSTGLYMLTAIKILHTAVWAVMASSILALPITAVMRHFRWSAALTLLILVECAVLAFNGGRCPLTNLAAHYTAERADNFDIYLPLWLARYNKTIFGALFIGGEVVFVGSFLRAKASL
jgi:hypothetical protein